MPRSRNALLLGLGAAAGAAVAYRAERALLRDRLAVSRVGTPLGSLDGELREIHGPDGVRLAVESYGPRGAPTVLLAHGWCCTGRIWHEQVAGLADRYRLITYDQPGHGRSSGPRHGGYRTDLFGDALAAVLTSCVPAGAPVVLVGHSLGGVTIMNLARRHPALLRDQVRETVLCSTTSRLERRVTRFLERADPRRVARHTTRAYRASSDLSHLLTRSIGLSPGADPRYVDFTEQLVLDADVDMLLGVARTVMSLDEDEGLAGLPDPTTIVCGTLDRLTPVGASRRIDRRVAHAELIELPGIGHMTPLEAGDAVNALIERAVQRASPAARVA